MAGLRTNALVATGSALFVLLSVGVHDSGSPTRVAAQVVSGTGFLGAGVILRDGLNVRGLNTAATLWCAAAVGSLAGAGLYVLASAGAFVVVVANVGLRPVARRIDREPGAGTEVESEYLFRAVCRPASEAHIRALLVQALTRPEFHLRAVHSEDLDNSQQVEVTADLVATHADGRSLGEF